MSSNKIGTVPCISVTSEGRIPCEGGKADEGGETECKFSHKMPCFYSARCTKKDSDAEHAEKYYHPKGKCKFGGYCTQTNDNHFLCWAHPCYAKECGAPTVAFLNGWLCHYHYKRLTRRYKAPRGSKSNNSKKEDVDSSN